MTAISLIPLSVLLLMCKPAARMTTNDVSPPDIRIGILEQRQSIEFATEGPMSFRNEDGSFAIRGSKDSRWRVEAIDSKPAQLTYRLAVGTTKNRIDAEEIVRSLARKGLDARIIKYDRPPSLTLKYVEKSIYQVVLTETFQSEDEVIEFQNEVRPKTGSEIIEIPEGEAEGLLRFTNLDSKYSFDSREAIKLTAEQVEILDVDVGTGYHWQNNETRNYDGAMEFILDAYGLITAVNELSLEAYLKGVVPSEMPVSFPLEALKAQAIAARVEAIAKIGLRHPLQPFDLCDDVHCQVFSGLSKRAEAANRAVESTRGLFMVYRNRLTEAFYAGVCGGHTENNENVWLMDAKPYLRGVLDTRGRGRQRLSSSLKDPDNVRKWIDSRPDVFCNAARHNVSKSLNYSKKYFRWQFEYERVELQEIIREKTGEDFGQLVDLVPIARGVSGRIIELEVIGTKKRFTISRELPIRQALSKNTLYSACFYVQKQGGAGGLADKFILRGAGWGHGVGMCQIGAAVMAYSGRKFDRILLHYYQGVVLEALYQ